MFAKVELTKELANFINESKKHTESFEEIKELIFTTEMIKKDYSFVEQINIVLQFQEIKNNTFYKALNNKELNYIEGMLLVRIIDKHNGLELPSFENHLEQVKECCKEIPPKSNFAKIFDFISERFS